MRVLSIGGAGQIGTAMAKHLPKLMEVTVLDWHEARVGERSLTGDATDPDVLGGAMDQMDAVIHLATIVEMNAQNTDLAVARRGFDVNVAGLYTALRAAIKAGVGSFVHFSTASVWADYGNRRIDVGAEEPDAISPYGLSKRMAEMMCASIAPTCDMTITSLRLVSPTTEEAWPLWVPPRAAGPAKQDKMPDGTEIPALAPSDLARAVEASLLRRGTYATPLISGDHDKISYTGDDTYELLGWSPLRRR